MAGTNFSSFPVSPFPQSICDIEGPGRLTDKAATRSQLTNCGWESAESTYGACDGAPCGAKATVYDTQTEQEYCAKHFREVSRA